MLKKLSLIAVLGSCGVLQTAQAIPVLSFDPLNPSVTQPGTVTVDAVLSGLTSANQVLSAFNVSVDFNSSVLQFVSGTTGTQFGTALSFSGAPSVSGSTISWDLVSLETDSTLQGIQGDSVTLGALTFDTLGVGTSTLSYSFADLTGLNGQALSASTAGGSVGVTGGGTSVPEPSTLLLLSAGAVALAWTKRRRAPGVGGIPS